MSDYIGLIVMVFVVMFPIIILANSLNKINN